MAVSRRHMLHDEGYSYVYLGEFSTDRLEKALSRLCQGSDKAHYVNEQQVQISLEPERVDLKITASLEFGD